MSTSVLKALPVKLDIKRHSPSILYLLTQRNESDLSRQSFQRITTLLLGDNCIQNFHFRRYIVGYTRVVSCLFEQRTSDSHNEGLPIKIARQKFQRKR